jgi:hypothetical protein
MDHAVQGNTFPSPALRFPRWHGEYEAVLRETDRKMQFKRVEIAEAVLLNCRDFLTHDSGGQLERQEIESALMKLRALKNDVLKYPL